MTNAVQIMIQAVSPLFATGAGAAGAAGAALAAAAAGASSVKFQTYRADTMTLDLDLPEFKVDENEFAVI